MISTINPATQERLHDYQQLSSSDVQLMIVASHQAFLIWRQTSFEYRADLMIKLATRLKQQQHKLARLITQEMGKPITQALAEIDKCVLICNHYALHAKDYLKTDIIKTEMQQAMISYQPTGVILGIMPWNFPFWQVFRFAVPALMAGNTVILKHACISLGCGEAIAQLFLAEDFDSNVLQHAILDNDGVSEVIAHPMITGVSFTGSDTTGRIIASQAGRYLKKSVLELGGNDPYIVLEDADIELAAACIVNSRLNNCGQVCIAAKRVIVVNSHHDELVDAIINQTKVYQMGNPAESATRLGPMSREDLRVKLHQQVSESINLGATCILGGTIPTMQGFYYPATLLINVAPGMPAFDQELFGPVIAITIAQDEAHAIKLANQSQFGLGAAIFTENIARGKHIATHDIEAGCCYVNTSVTSDPRLPFGGIKQSGYGRELSCQGIWEFINVKTIVIK